MDDREFFHRLHVSDFGSSDNQFNENISVLIQAGRAGDYHIAALLIRYFEGLDNEKSCDQSLIEMSAEMYSRFKTWLQYISSGKKKWWQFWR